MNLLNSYILTRQDKYTVKIWRSFIHSIFLFPKPILFNLFQRSASSVPVQPTSTSVLLLLLSQPLPWQPLNIDRYPRPSITLSLSHIVRWNTTTSRWWNVRTRNKGAQCPTRQIKLLKKSNICQEVPSSWSCNVAKTKADKSYELAKRLVHFQLV